MPPRSPEGASPEAAAVVRRWTRQENEAHGRDPDQGPSDVSPPSPEATPKRGRGRQVLPPEPGSFEAEKAARLAELAASRAEGEGKRKEARKAAARELVETAGQRGSCISLEAEPIKTLAKDVGVSALLIQEPGKTSPLKIPRAKLSKVVDAAKAFPEVTYAANCGPPEGEQRFHVRWTRGDGRVGGLDLRGDSDLSRNANDVAIELPPRSSLPERGAAFKTPAKKPAAPPAPVLEELPKAARGRGRHVSKASTYEPARLPAFAEPDELEELATARDLAVHRGDRETVRRAQERIAEIRSTEKPAPAPSPQEWMKEHLAVVHVGDRPPPPSPVQAPAAPAAEPTPKAARAAKQPRSLPAGPPAGGMAAAAINRELDALEKRSRKNTEAFIAAGRGEERPSEYLKKSDPLALEARALFDRVGELRGEIDRRYGPGAPSRLPRGFGPIGGKAAREREAEAAPEPVKSGNGERAKLVQLAAASADRAARAYAGWSAADKAEAPAHEAIARVYQGVAEGKSVDDLIAKEDRQFRAYAAERDAEIKRAPKTRSGPYSGQSAARHQWVSPDYFEAQARHVRHMVGTVLGGKATTPAEPATPAGQPTFAELAARGELDRPNWTSPDPRQSGLAFASGVAAPGRVVALTGQRPGPEVEAVPGQRVRWEGDQANEPRSGVVVSFEPGGYSSIQWDGDEKPHRIPSALLSSVRWSVGPAPAAAPAAEPAPAESYEAETAAAEPAPAESYEAETAAAPASPKKKRKPRKRAEELEELEPVEDLEQLEELEELGAVELEELEERRPRKRREPTEKGITVREVLVHGLLVVGGTVLAVELDKRIEARPLGLRPSVYAFGASVGVAVAARRYGRPKLARGAASVAVGLAAGMVGHAMIGG